MRPFLQALPHPCASASGWIVLLGSLLLFSQAALGEFKVGLVLDRGGKDDKSFNSSAYEGATQAKNKLGIVGGMDIPLIRRFEMGYEAGAKKVNPQVTVLANFVGITSEAWNNPPKGKELAVSQYDAGADVIFAAAGASGLGVFDAAEEKKKFAIGVDSNQDWTKPGLILTSMLKRVDEAIFSIITEAK